MAITVDAILDCLNLTEESSGRWTGPQLQMDYRRTFGGQLLAQAVAVGALSAPGKTVKSVVASFPREGSLDKELVFDVSSPMTGRTFATRHMQAAQDDKVYFLATVSLHDPNEPGLAHQLPAPSVGGPDDAVAVDLGMIPWETRVVGGVDLSSHDQGPPEFSFWMRVADRRLPDDQMVHQAIAAYGTDLTLIGTALRAHDGYSQADTMITLHTGVTTHQMWFHRPLRADEWLLVHQHSPISGGGRAFGLGHIYSADGTLVASFAQEALIRLIDTPQAH